MLGTHNSLQIVKDSVSRALHTMEMPTAPPPQSQRKRVRFPYADDSDEDTAPRLKKVRFPKGKKDSESSTKNLGAVNGEEDEGPILLSTNPRVAALERATRRDRATEQLLAADETSVNDSLAEEEYDEEDEEKIEDGMRFEPFNLKQEREEGYFDAEGNYVEYRNDNDTRDAWLESTEVDTRFARKTGSKSKDELMEESDQDKELSKEEIAGIKRRIADALESGETVLRALRRLKGVQKQMAAEKKVLFDQLTEDAMKLLDNGDYNVYEERKETFLREAEGYEALMRLRTGGTNGAAHSSGEGSSSSVQFDIFSNGQAAPPASAVGAVKENGDAVDIFGGSDDEDAAENPVSNLTGKDGLQGGGGGEGQEALNQSEGSLIPADGSGYVFDETSGFYYNSVVGYYYDAKSGLYCSASTGHWYKFDAVLNTYELVTG